ncbi:FAD-dependent protein, partial [Vibrio parahaemolyticus]|uniref:FAD-dependent protein n=1 Tax=Vibrio parahaemolyticus TaxID=670 RepID=UPI0031334307
VNKPHIGTFKLGTMIQKMRATIIELGGKIPFSPRVDDLHMEDGPITAVTLSDGEEIKSRHVVLAVGHSSRDTFEMLHERVLYMGAKPFSFGLRIEPQQSKIAEARFSSNAGHPILGAAEYKMVHHCQ